MKVYENVFNINDNVYVREYDVETNETSFSKHKMLMPLFYPSQEGKYKAYERYGKNTKLVRKDLDFKTYLQERKLFIESGRMLYGRTNIALE